MSAAKVCLIFVLCLLQAQVCYIRVFVLLSTKLTPLSCTFCYTLFSNNMFKRYITSPHLYILFNLITSIGKCRQIAQCCQMK